MTNHMKFHKFLTFVEGQEPAILSINGVVLGGLTKSGKFRCILREHLTTFVDVHTGVNLDRPEINPFFLLQVELVGDGPDDGHSYIATDLTRWCKAIKIYDNDVIGNRVYDIYMSIRPSDLRGIVRPEWLSTADKDNIEQYIARSKILKDQ